MPSRHRKFLSYYRPYLGLLAADLLCAILLSGTLLLLPLGVRHITKLVLAGVTPHTMTQIYAVGGAMVGLTVLFALCKSFVDYQGHMMGAFMERDLRRELFDHYQRLSYDFYDAQKTGQLMSRITNDSFAISELYHHGPEDLLISLLSFVGAFAIMISINARLALAIFAFLPLMALYTVVANRKMRRAMRATRQIIGHMNEQVEDTLAGIRVVQAFHNEVIEAAKFAHQNERFVGGRRLEYRSYAYFHVAMESFMQLITVALIIVGVLLIAHGALDTADLLAFLLTVGLLFEPITRFSNFTRLYQEGITGFERFMEILDQPPTIRDAPAPLELTRACGRIEFRCVSFRYRPDGPDVLHDLCLTIAPGEYVALVGASGVGKSTLCALIPRFYDVTAGAICLDGVDVRALSLASLRAQIGVVHQEVYLFAGTVADNIGYGRPGASRDEIVAAARQANAHDFITALPQGYDSEVGQRGVKLSGGQKQRLSIARLFLKDPPILILDEATSALDARSERAVQQSLEALIHDRTTIVIAHRLATVRNAARLIVLDGGTIVEQGTHDELLARDGCFAALYRSQLRL